MNRAGEGQPERADGGTLGPWTLRCRLTVGREPLELATLVRIQLPQPDRIAQEGRF